MNTNKLNGLKIEAENCINSGHGAGYSLTGDLLKAICDLEHEKLTGYGISISNN